MSDSSSNAVHTDYAWTLTLANIGITIVGVFGAINQPMDIINFTQLTTIFIAAFSSCLIVWVWWYLKKHFSAFYTKGNDRNTFVYCAICVSLWTLHSSGYFFVPAYWLPLWSIVLSTLNSCFMLRFLYLLNIEEKPNEENYELLLSKPFNIVSIGAIILSIEVFFFLKGEQFYLLIDIFFSTIVLVYLLITLSEIFARRLPLMIPFLVICFVLTFIAIFLIEKDHNILFLGIWQTGLNSNLLFQVLKVIYKILLIFIFLGLSLSWPFFIRTIEAINANRTIDHRIKNFLNRLNAEFDLRSDTSLTPNASFEVFSYMRKKIAVMNALHKLMSKRSDIADHNSIENQVSGKSEFREYIIGLSNTIAALFKKDGIVISFDIKAVEPGIHLNTDFTSKIGEVIYELVANSVKHHPINKPTVIQHIICNKKKLIIEHYDDGDGVTYEQLAQSEGLGAWLMKDTVNGYGGEMSVSKDKKGQNVFKFSFLITNIL